MSIANPSTNGNEKTVSPLFAKYGKQLDDTVRKYSDDPVTYEQPVDSTADDSDLTNEITIASQERETAIDSEPQPEILPFSPGCSNDVDKPIACTPTILTAADTKALQKSVVVDQQEPMENDRSAERKGKVQSAKPTRPGVAPGQRPSECHKGSAASSGDGDGGKGNKDGPKKSYASQLVDLIECVELWHTPGIDGIEYATLNVNGHKESYAIRSRGFRRWLCREFYKLHGAVPGSEIVQNALDVIGGKACYEGPEHEAHVRVALQDGAIYLDLGSPNWEVVRIDDKGWEVCPQCPVYFTRRRGMLALPVPEEGRSLDPLRNLLHVPDKDAWTLIEAWLLDALRPGYPHPVLALNGEQGSGKSTRCKMLRGLIDPNESPLRRPPRDERDLMIAATNSWIVGFDNISHIRPDLSDALCGLSTGIGLGTRLLWTDDEEKLFTAMRPVLVNGIGDVITREDLLDRCILVTLPPITRERRRTEEALWAEYERIRPSALGALLTTVSRGLRQLPAVKLDSLERMADFTLWVAACQPLIRRKDFLQAYARNRGSINQTALEGSLIVGHLHSIVERTPNWEGTAQTLLTVLEGIAPEYERRMAIWPKSPRGLSGILRRLAPALRAVGLCVTFTEEYTRHGKMLRLERTAS